MTKQRGDCLNIDSLLKKAYLQMCGEENALQFFLFHSYQELYKMISRIARV